MNCATWRLGALAWIASACAAVAVAQQKAATHWADRPIARPAVPDLQDADWARDPIDVFVLDTMRRNGIEPAPRAVRSEWLRRASLDLCGLPPTPQQAAEFAADRSIDAYERQVQRMLASRAFGERWAQWWLDLVRYADSQGYEKDALRRDMWRYRDYVVDAFCADMPLDRFTIEQLAGDLLPDASIEQRIATAMHRNTMTNTEGGTDDEEFRSAAVVDRVNTTMSVWMGATAGCAQCHDHKYDPISQREYFQLYALLDQTADADRADESPTLRAPTAEQAAHIARIESELSEVDAALEALPRAAWIESQRQRIAAFAAAAPALSPWRLAGPFEAKDFHAEFERLRAGAEPPAHDAGLIANGWLDRADLVDGAVHELRGAQSTFWLSRTITVAADCDAVLALGSDDAVVAWIDGTIVHANKASRAAVLGQDIVEVRLAEGSHRLLLAIVNGGGIGGFAFELRATPMGKGAEASVMRDGSERDESVVRAFLQASPDAFALRTRRDALRAEFAAIPVPSVPVLQELPGDRRRTTRVHLRGSFLTQGDVVAGGVPACWPQLPSGAPQDRLTFARWLMSDDNPRTARVFASRAWEQLFGRGLVATSEDFGVQGDAPSHPELLDWIACELREGGWSWKKLLSSIVLSATYRQGPVPADGARERDPQNRWCARSPRLRLSAEMLRDQALFVSGLLSAKVGGPSVMPLQPDGVWGQIYSGERWATSEGDDRHRRSLYTLWRRTSPHPTMTTFDAPSREFCVVRRIATNTPLQFLALWNDPQFVECRDALAASVRQATKENGDMQFVRLLYERCLMRRPTRDEYDALGTWAEAERAALRAQGLDAEAIEARVAQGMAGVLMTSDEFLVRG